MKAIYKTKKDANGMFRLARRVIVEEHIGRKLNRNEYVQTCIEKPSTLLHEQPAECVFGYGCCGYPIDDCYNCPCHTWSDYGMPLTTCKFK